MKVSEKMKAIRAAEGLSQSQFCKLVDIPVSTLKNIEGEHSVPNYSTISKITQHERFTKYTLWLMTDKTAPEVGQVEPVIVHAGKNEKESVR
ncbi:helix-turn-helix domain-containing protein [Klebsiella michiganensis]|uniref:helix-turn-helix domain-containing protein n=1 Tax=Klebsiella michiganensis TaxID=1134687 RepID=UPI003981F4FE